MSEDPLFLGNPKGQVLTDPQSLNSYSYANDNPITRSDPTGRAVGIDDLIAFGVGGVVNFSAYTITSAVTGQRMIWGGAAGSFVSGGIVGVGIDNAPETGVAFDRICPRIVGKLETSRFGPWRFGKALTIFLACPSTDPIIQLS